jgi:hypothetical protein
MQAYIHTLPRHPPPPLSLSLSHMQSELTEMYGAISQVKLSPSSSQLLLVVNETQVYRHSFLADYFLYDNEWVMTYPY